MRNMGTLLLERDILSSKKFSRLQQISLAVDYLHVKDSAQTRASHSVEVANTVEIMNLSISTKVGFDIDRLGVGRIVGLLHDIGHTSFGHEGERKLQKLSKEYSNEAFSFEGNANNYITIQKNQLLYNATKEVRQYVLASLAKHADELYPEQESIKTMLKKSAKEDKAYINLHKGFNVKYLDKTLQCQIMDIADENCYIISDIIDGINVLSDIELSAIFRKELPINIAEDLIFALIGGKNSFRRKMQVYHEAFCMNFTLSKKGEIVYEDKEIEKIRKAMAKINVKYILNSKSVIELREKASKKIETVFRFYFENENPDLIPSNFYRKEFKKSYGIDRLRIIRNMLGSLTNKGLIKEYKKIQDL
jgi:dGTP triphosphohydrolase